MRRGFTLTELLTVLAVITIVISFSLSAVSRGRARARDDRRIGDLKLIQSSLEAYRLAVDQGTAGSQAEYAYPLRYFANSEISGPGLYSAGPWQNYLRQTPRDPLTQKEYLYFAPACVRPGKGTVSQPLIVTPARSAVFQTATAMASAGNTVCPQGAGWVPYALYVLLERPLTAKSQLGLVSLADSNPRAVVYAPAAPLYWPNESPGQPGGAGNHFLAGQSRCFPPLPGICPDGYNP